TALVASSLTTSTTVLACSPTTPASASAPVTNRRAEAMDSTVGGNARTALTVVFGGSFGRAPVGGRQVGPTPTTSATPRSHRSVGTGLQVGPDGRRRRRRRRR